MPYRIAIVEDMRRTLLALTKDLGEFENIEIMFTAVNGHDYLEQLKKLPPAKHPQVVLMDIEMPVMDGIDAVRQGVYLYTDIQYIMFSVSDEDDKLFEAIRAGASGYFLKDEPTDKIIEGINEVIEKCGAPMSPAIARKTLKLLAGNYDGKQKETPVANDLLSAREIEILKGMVDGLEYKQIAGNLFISPNTVRNHIASIYEKLHISSKTQAVKMAIKNKWV